MRFGSATHVILATLNTVTQATSAQLLELFSFKRKTGIRTEIHRLLQREHIERLGHGIYAITQEGKLYLQIHAPVSS